MQTRPSIGKVLPIVLLFACAASACVGSPAKQNAASTTAPATSVDNAQSTPAPGPATVNIKVLEQAIAKTKSVTTGHFTVGGDASGSTGPGTANDDKFMQEHAKPPSPDDGIKGVFDRGHARAEVDPNGGFGLKSMVVDGGHYYVELATPSNVAKPWTDVPAKSIPGLKAMLLASVDPTDPMSVLQHLKFVGSTAKVLGHEKLGGTAVMRYEAHVDLNVLMDAIQVSDPSSGLPDTHPYSAGASNVPIDLWVDEAGNVRRIWYVASYDVKESGSGTSPSGKTQTSDSTGRTDVAFSLTVTHFGEPVSISVPPPSQVAVVPSGGVPLG